MDNKNDLYFVVKWKSQMKKGLLEYIIMVLLQKQDYYGYELISDVKQYVSIEVADGTIYPLLNRLKKEGVVKSEWIQMGSGIPRKYYKITDTGIKYLDLMKEYYSSLISSIKGITDK